MNGSRVSERVRVNTASRFIRFTDKALRDPLASVELAQENLQLIAPHVKFAGTVLDAQKLAVDVYFLEENIRELAVSLPKSNSQPPPGGTGIVPR